MHGHGEAASQLGEPDEEQAQAVFGVHGEVGQEPKVFEDVVSQVLCLVDDEHGELVGLGEQAGDFGADGAVGRWRASVRWAVPVPRRWPCTCRGRFRW